MKEDLIINKNTRLDLLNRLLSFREFVLLSFSNHNIFKIVMEKLNIINDIYFDDDLYPNDYLEFRNDKFELLHRQKYSDFQASLGKYPTIKPPFHLNSQLSKLLEGMLDVNSEQPVKELKQEITKIKNTLRAERRAYYKQVLRADVSDEELDPTRSIVLLSSKGVVIITTCFKYSESDVTRLRVINWGEADILDALNISSSHILSSAYISQNDTSFELVPFELVKLKEAFILFNIAEQLLTKVAEDDDYIYLAIEEEFMNGPRLKIYRKIKNSDSPRELVTPGYPSEVFIWNIYRLPGIDTFALNYDLENDKIYVYLNLIDFLTETTQLSKFSYELEVLYVDDFDHFFRFFRLTIGNCELFITIDPMSSRMLVGILSPDNLADLDSFLRDRLPYWVSDPRSQPNIIEVPRFYIPPYPLTDLNYLDTDELVYVEPCLLHRKPDISLLPRVYNDSPTKYYSFPKKQWQRVSLKLPEELRHLSAAIRSKRIKR